MKTVRGGALTNHTKRMRTAKVQDKTREHASSRHTVHTHAEKRGAKNKLTSVLMTTWIITQHKRLREEERMNEQMEDKKKKKKRRSRQQVNRIEKNTQHAHQVSVERVMEVVVLPLRHHHCCWCDSSS
jgi:hypothetical protein